MVRFFCTCIGKPARAGIRGRYRPPSIRQCLLVPGLIRQSPCCCIWPMDARVTDSLHKNVHLTFFRGFPFHTSADAPGNSKFDPLTFTCPEREREKKKHVGAGKMPSCCCPCNGALDRPSVRPLPSARALSRANEMGARDKVVGQPVRQSGSPSRDATPINLSLSDHSSGWLCRRHRAPQDGGLR